MTTGEILEWVNAFELIISLAAIVLLSRYIYGQISSWHDLYLRTLKLLTRDFQGGPYDLAVALLTLIVGKSLRAAVIWEWRHFGGELNHYLLALAIIIVSLGMLCTIRVLTSKKYFNHISIGVGLLAAFLASFSVYF